MYPGFIIAGRAMKATQYALDVLAHNIANTTTTGYKRDFPISRFEEELTAARLHETDYSQGPMMDTGEPLDLAVKGKALFVVATPAGPRYTRNGQFKITTNADESQLTTSNGLVVLGEEGPLILSGKGAVRIDISGRITEGGTSIGRLRMVWPTDPRDLTKEGAGFLRADTQPPPAVDFTVRQGYIEKSNVRIVEEMGALLAATRGHEASARSLKVLDRTLSRMLTVVRGRI